MSKTPMTAEDFAAVLYAESERRLEEEEKEPDVFTRREVQKSTGMSEKKALSFMKELMTEGKAKPIFTARKDAWGRVQPNIPAIRLNMEELNVPFRDSG